MFSCRLKLALYFLILILAFVNPSLTSAAHAAAPVLNSIILSDPDSGSTEYTNNSTINVSLSVSGSPAQMLLSKYSDFHDATWTTYTNPRTFTFEIPTSNGTRFVYCKLKNANSEESNPAQDDINVDTFRPSISAANSGSVNTTHVDIMFSEVTIIGADNPANYTITSGITVLGAQLVWVPSVYLYKYRLATTPQTPGVQYTVTASGNLKDPAGNLVDPDGRTFTYTAVSSTDTITPQVNSFSIQNGDAYTENRDVTISMTESDQGGLVKKWLITTTQSTPPQSSFTLTSRPVTYTLSAGNGTKTLYAWVMDDSGNISYYNPANSTDSIILDETPSAYLKVRGPDPDYNTITEAMAGIAEGGTIYVYPGEYNEDVHMKEGVILSGDNNITTIIRGNVFFEEASGTIDNFTILFQEGTALSFTNVNYADWDLIADSGITAVNSAPVVKNCIIKPDLDFMNDEGGYDPPLEYYGKAIQIWNMYGTSDVAPQIEGNLIQDTDCGIYYFSQVFGGAISGSIKNNTFYHNKDGIILRMHKENPHIYNNIFDNSGDAAIFLTYEDGELFTQRKASINNNLFNQNADNFRLDSSLVPFDLIGIQGNVEDDPLFIDPAGGNFYLEPASPALTGGEGGALMGAYAEFVSHLFIKITSPQDGITIYARP